MSYDIDVGSAALLPKQSRHNKKETVEQSTWEIIMFPLITDLESITLAVPPAGGNTAAPGQSRGARPPVRRPRG